MINNTARRDAILAELDILRDEIQQRPPGPERAKAAQKIGKAISAINSAQSDRDVGDAQLRWHGVKV